MDKINMFRDLNAQFDALTRDMEQAHLAGEQVPLNDHALIEAVAEQRVAAFFDVLMEPR